MNGISRKVFQEMCYAFVPLDDILLYFGTSKKQLDIWCKREFGRGLDVMMAHLYAVARVQIRLQIRERANFGNDRMIATLAKENLTNKKVNISVSAPAVKDPEDDLKTINNIVSAARVQ